MHLNLMISLLDYLLVTRLTIRQQIDGLVVGHPQALGRGHRLAETLRGGRQLAQPVDDLRHLGGGISACVGGVWKAYRLVGSSLLGSPFRVQFQYSQTLTPIATKGVRQEVRCHLDNWLRKQRLDIEAELHHYAAPRLFF